METIAIISWCMAAVVWLIGQFAVVQLAEEFSQLEPDECKRLGGPMSSFGGMSLTWILYIVSGSYKARVQNPDSLSTMNIARWIFIVTLLFAGIGFVFWCLR